MQETKWVVTYRCDSCGKVADDDEHKDWPPELFMDDGVYISDCNHVSLGDLCSLECMIKKLTDRSKADCWR